MERKLVGEVVSRFELKGLNRRDGPAHPRADTLARHYEEHVGKGFYADLVEFMGRGPVVAMVIEGPEDTWEVVRTMMGATNPRKAATGTIAVTSASCSPRTSSTAATPRDRRTRDRHLLPDL